MTMPAVSNVSLPPHLSTLEYVGVTVWLAHTCRGALEISLQSPTLTWTTLASSRKHDTYVVTLSLSDSHGVLFVSLVLGAAMV